MTHLLNGGEPGDTHVIPVTTLNGSPIGDGAPRLLFARQLQTLPTGPLSARRRAQRPAPSCPDPMSHAPLLQRASRDRSGKVGPVARALRKLVREDVDAGDTSDHEAIEGLPS